MKITVVGTGYVGLVAGTCLADSGQTVVCVDKAEKKIQGLLNGQIPIYEPGLTDLVTRNTREGRLTFTTDLKAAVGSSQVAFICVGTPKGEDGRADLSAVRAVAKAIAEAMTDYLTVVMKSTVPVGTADMVRDIISKNTSHEFDVVSNPEFLKEGAAVNDFNKPDRVVIGVKSERSEKVMKHIYAPFVRNGNPIIVMDNRSAEFTKYAANCMLATKISFINEMANLAEKLGADIDFVRSGITTDQRIGRHFLFPGAGYGGSCFPKDVDALIESGQDIGYTLEIMESVKRVNEKQKSVLFQRVVKCFGEDLKGHKFAVWGLAFKPRTDDMREAPSIVLINALLAAGAEVVAHDPEARDNAKEIFGDTIELKSRYYDCLEDASALIVVTEWNEFRRPDFERIKQSLKSPIVIDGRNLYDPERMAQLGFDYYGIGKGRSVETVPLQK